VAAEIEAPRRNYLRAIAIAIPMVVLGYILPLAASLSGTGAGGEQWHTGWFAEEGVLIGGPILGKMIGIGGALSAFSIFQAAMLWVSRMPYVLACEGYLPRRLTEIWSGRATPGPSILLCCAVFTLLIPIGFVALVVFDVFFYMFALVLEMAALIRLRRLRPGRDGLFTIRGGRVALYAVAAAPILTWVATFAFAASSAGGKRDLIVALLLAACAWPAYLIARRRYGGPPAA
jgi:amino acid transporter